MNDLGVVVIAVIDGRLRVVRPRVDRVPVHHWTAIERGVEVLRRHQSQQA